MWTSISVTVIAALFLALFVLLIPVLVQIRRMAKEGEKLLEATRLQIVPLSHDVIRVMNDVHDIIKSAKNQMSKVEDSVDAVRDTAMKLRDVETILKDKVEQPLLNLIAIVSALVKGTRAFLDYMRHE